MIEDKTLIAALRSEARSNDHKILVYPYRKRVRSNQIGHRIEWHVMREGNRSTRIFHDKASAVAFAHDLNNKKSGEVIISR